LYHTGGVKHIEEEARGGGSASEIRRTIEIWYRLPDPQRFDCSNIWLPKRDPLRKLARFWLSPMYGPDNACGLATEDSVFHHDPTSAYFSNRR
jgi:hypothetical protein